jgi:hypothetical protein
MRTENIHPSGRFGPLARLDKGLLGCGNGQARSGRRQYLQRNAYTVSFGGNLIGLPYHLSIRIAVLSQSRAKSEFVLRMHATENKNGFKLQGDFGRIYQRVAAYNSKHKEKHFRCMQHPVNKQVFVIRDR